MKIGFHIKGQDDELTMAVRAIDEMLTSFSIVGKDLSGSFDRENVDAELSDTKEYIRFSLCESAPESKVYLPKIEFVSEDIIDAEENIKDKIADLYIRIVDAAQRGEDISDSEVDTIEKEPYDPEMIRVETKSFAIKSVFDMIVDEDIDISPDFQRNEVWDIRRKSRLIESILLRIPLPTFYFAQTDDGVLHVVDGMQRLSAIRDFMQNKLLLRDLEYLKECEGLTYSADGNSIDTKLRRRLNQTQITANVIDPQSPIRVKFDIFRRINTGGRPLNAQELRNCVMSDRVRKLLKEMVSSRKFTEATGKSVSDTRMAAQELALRYVLFKKKLIDEGSISSYSGNMDEDLNNLIDALAKETDCRYEIYRTSFENAMENATFLFGKHAFRKVGANFDETTYKNIINKALFLTWSLVLGEIEPEQIKSVCIKGEMVKILGSTIDNDTAYKEYISYNTNGWKNLMYSYNEAVGMMDDLKMSHGIS